MLDKNILIGGRFKSGGTVVAPQCVSRLSHAPRSYAANAVCQSHKYKGLSYA